MSFDLVKLVDQLKTDEQTFFLSPKQWNASSVPPDLDWDWVPFDKDHADAVPSDRGVYAFVVELDKAGIPPHGYVMYVGETGNKSKETLHTRFLSYFREMKKQCRAVHYALIKYKEHMYFHFSRITDNRRNLRKVEESLCSTLIPPCNRRDFDWKLRRARRAF